MEWFPGTGKSGPPVVSSCWRMFLHLPYSPWQLRLALWVVCAAAVGLEAMLPLAALATLWGHGLVDAVLLLLLGLLCVSGVVVASGNPPRARRSPQPATPTSQGWAGGSVVLREISASRMVQINTLGLTLMAAVFAYYLARSGAILPLSLALGMVNSPLTTIVSRDADAQRMLRQMPSTAGYFRAYAFGLAGVFLVAGIPQLVVYGIWRPAGLLPSTLMLLALAVTCAILSAYLEYRYPLRGWKTERDVLRHPRKYLVPGFGLLLVLGVVVTI